MTDDASSRWSDLLAEGRLPRFALLCLGIWLNAADALVTATIMPSVAADIGGYAYFGWAVAVFMLGAIVAGASAGALSNRWGLKRAMLAGAFAYAVGCGLGAASPGVAVFLVGRLLQGIGAGWIVGLSFVAITLVFPPSLWARLFGAISGVWGVATLLGPLVGGLFAGAGFWRGAFWLFAGQGVLFAGAAWALLPPAAAPEPHPIALRQLGVLTLGVLAIAVGGLVKDAALALALVIGGLAVLAILLWLDRRLEPRLLPRSAGDLRGVAGSAYFTQFAMCASSAVLAVYGAALLQARYGLTPLAAGYAIAAEAVGWSITALTVAGIAQRLQGRAIRIGVTLVPLSLAALAFAIPSGSLALVLVGAAALGVGFGSSWSFITRKVLASLPEHERAFGSSATAAVQLTGQAVGAAAIGALGNWLGLGEGLNSAIAGASALWLFGASVPVAVLAWLAAGPLTKEV